MNIKTPNFGEFTLVNFTKLSQDEKLCVLKMRNYPEIKKWMYSAEDISELQHLSFIESLSNNSIKKYFLVTNRDIIGVIYFNDIFDESCSFGLYANPFVHIPGVGRMLEELAIAYASRQLKIKHLNLEVFEGNKKVINLHKKYGFSSNGEKIVNGKNVLTMVLCLDEMQ
jgi:UDP-4-amino-4,6-dideoxy-N-acetyl-beta-L-altrosamine N-acetyltransferase